MANKGRGERSNSRPVVKRRKRQAAMEEATHCAINSIKCLFQETWSDPHQWLRLRVRLGISKRLVVLITLDFSLLICRAQPRLIVRIYAATDYQPGLIQKYIFIIMILLCNCKTEPAGLFMTPSVIHEPKILPLDRKLPVVVATLPKEKQTKRVGSNPNRFFAMLHFTIRQQEIYVKRTFY